MTDKQITAYNAAAWFALDVVCVLEPDGFFRAIDRNNYDVDCDHARFFSNSPTGYGRTPLDAIVDLLDEIDARKHVSRYATSSYVGRG